MRTQYLAITLASMALISGPAFPAQTSSPYGVGSFPPETSSSASMSEEDWTRLVTQRIAACLVRTHRTAVLNAIQPEPWQPAASHMLENVVEGGCLGNDKFVMPPDLFRGAFYQELYRERFASNAPVLPPAAIDFTAASSTNLSDEARTDIALRQFGDCVARRDLSDANAMIFSSPGSEQETNALKGLMPHLSACLMRGSKWTLTRSSITAILSEVIYREATSARPDSPR